MTVFLDFYGVAASVSPCQVLALASQASWFGFLGLTLVVLMLSPWPVFQIGFSGFMLVLLGLLILFALQSIWLVVAYSGVFGYQLLCLGESMGFFPPLDKQDYG